MANAFDEIKEVSLEGFQVVSGTLFKRIRYMNDPAITFWYNSISFNKAAVIALNRCERVRIEINPTTRCILLVPVTIKDKDAVRWATIGKDTQPRKIECITFTSQLFKTWNWDKDYVYRATGRIVSSDRKVMLFYDFSEPEKWPLKQKVMANTDG